MPQIPPFVQRLVDRAAKIKVPHKLILMGFLGFGALLMAVAIYMGFSASDTGSILAPKGEVAEKELNLIIISTLLMLVVVLPVFWMTIHFTHKFRAGNTRARYRPNWENNNWLEAIWWGLPCVIIIALGVIIWFSSYDLDPKRPLSHSNEPINVQVVAMNWKWLFIYPDYDVASVNYLQVPVDRPINFRLTGDGPMNSFWIPSLGGQIYTMAGMETRLHLIANEAGDYRGSSANISGEGFAGMVFTARASSQSDFDQWISQVRVFEERKLDNQAYKTLAKPSVNVKPSQYSSVQDDLYDTIMGKYMAPSHRDKHHSQASSGHDGGGLRH